MSQIFVWTPHDVITLVAMAICFLVVGVMLGYTYLSIVWKNWKGKK